MEKHYEIHTKTKRGEEGDLLILKFSDKGLEVLMHPFEPGKKIFVNEIKKEDLGEVTGKYRPAWHISGELSKQGCNY